MELRLFNYGIGIHLLQTEDPHQLPTVGGINPKDNHISFQVISLERFTLTVWEIYLNILMYTSDC